MTLYSFHKQVRPITERLVVYNVPFTFKSVGSFHCLCVPYVDFINSPLSRSKTLFLSHDMTSLCSKAGLSVVLEFGKILVF